MTETILTIIFFVGFLVVTFLLLKSNRANQSLQTKLLTNIYSKEDFEKELETKIDKKTVELRTNIAKQFEDGYETKKELLEKQNQIEYDKLEKKLLEQFRLKNDDLVTQEASIKAKKELLVEDQNFIKAEKERLEEIKLKLGEIKSNLELRESEIQGKLQAELIKIAGIDESQAQEILLAQTRNKTAQDLINLQSKMLIHAEHDANLKAREIVSMAIQRCSSEVTNEITITTVKITNDDDKGKLIGKNGRNIQWLEKTLGIELIIDETPGVITISGFSGVRRHIAKRTVEKLLMDGRVHPASIEEMYEKAKDEISQEIQLAGEEVVNELGIYNFPDKLVKLIGRLKFRTSYGQNMLKHSLEMAKLAGILADDLNVNFPTNKPIDRMICVQGALLHDIGKAVDEEMVPKGDHVEIGSKLCDMFELDEKVKMCITSHHQTGGDFQSYETKSGEFCIEACLVDACDNMSGSRPGARKDSTESYFQRLEQIEKIINSMPGITKSYIMRGMKEIYVFFDPKSKQAGDSQKLMHEISDQITSMVKSPFKIKITGFLEERFVEYTA
jgi:ribonucrease Y